MNAPYDRDQSMQVMRFDAERIVDEVIQAKMDRTIYQLISKRVNELREEVMDYVDGRWNDAQKPSGEVRYFGGSLIHNRQDSSSIDFLQSGTGATTRTVQDKLREWMSVLDKGADNTGAVDSATAFSNAATYTGFVLVPPGTYLLNSNPTAAVWLIAPGVTFTGTGVLTGRQIQYVGGTSAFTSRLIVNNLTDSQQIGFDIEHGLYQTGAVSADSFGQTTELWTPSSGTATYSGQLTATYGSMSHFGSGSITGGIVGGGFEGFNSGAATVTLVEGVVGNAYNGGVAAGDPQQTPSNNGVASNLRGVAGFVENLSTGTVPEASAIYAEAAANTGGGAITNVYGVHVAIQTAGANNYGFYSDGNGVNSFGDAIQVRSSPGLPASAGSTSLWLGAGPALPSAGRIYCGDGTGWRVEFVKRTASTDTVVGYVQDNGSVVATNGCLSSSGANGYAQSVGAGGAVTQLTSKGTAVTLNKATGQITMHNASLAAGASVSFNLNNSFLLQQSMLVLAIQAGVTPGAYVLTVENMQGGVCDITLRNASAGALAEAVVLNFAVIQGASS